MQQRYCKGPLIHIMMIKRQHQKRKLLLASVEDLFPQSLLRLRRRCCRRYRRHRRRRYNTALATAAIATAIATASAITTAIAAATHTAAALPSFRRPSRGDHRRCHRTRRSPSGWDDGRAAQARGLPAAHAPRRRHHA